MHTAPSPLVGEGDTHERSECGPGEGSLSAHTTRGENPSPGFISLRSISPPSPTRREGALPLRMHGGPSQRWGQRACYEACLTKTARPQGASPKTKKPRGIRGAFLFFIEIDQFALRGWLRACTRGA